ncbi:MAG: glycosyltransferase family 9 protein [Nitrospinota bacterium]
MKGADQNPPVFSLDSSSGEATNSNPSGKASGKVLTIELGRIEPPEAPRAAPSAQQKSPPRQYAYRSRWAVRLFRLLDGLGAALLARERDRPKVIERVIVLRPDHIGDVLFSLPALRALRNELPDARIDLLIGPWARPLLPDDSKNLYGIELIEFSAPWLERPKKDRFGLMAALGLARLLRRRAHELGGAYDLAVDLRGDFQSILAARLAGARYLAGSGRTGLGFFLDVELEEMRGRHQVERNLALIESAGFGYQETTNPELELTRDEIEQGRALLRTHGVDGSRIVIGIHAGAGNPTKIWGVDKFAGLIRRIITNMPSQVVIFGGPDDRSVTDDVMIALKGLRTEGRVVDLCDKLPGLRSFMMAARHCTLFVGNDSGPGHIAAALGVPVISVFSGTNDPAEWGPRGSSVVIVRKRIECEVCGLTFCDHHSGMAGLDSDIVYEALRRCV